MNKSHFFHHTNFLFSCEFHEFHNVCLPARRLNVIQTNRTKSIAVGKNLLEYSNRVQLLSVLKRQIARQAGAWKSQKTLVEQFFNQRKSKCIFEIYKLMKLQIQIIMYTFKAQFSHFPLAQFTSHSTLDWALSLLEVGRTWNMPGTFAKPR